MLLLLYILSKWTNNCLTCDSTVILQVLMYLLRYLFRMYLCLFIGWKHVCYQMILDLLFIVCSYILQILHKCKTLVMSSTLFPCFGWVKTESCRRAQTFSIGFRSGGFSGQSVHTFSNFSFIILIFALAVCIIIF